MKPPLASAGAEASEAEPVGERKVFLGDRELTAAVYDGATLTPGQALEGLAIIDDVDTTLLVPAGARLAIDGMRNYVFEIEPAYVPANEQATAVTAG